METDHDAIRRGDCPAFGEGFGHAWVSSDNTSDCTACGMSIPKAQQAPRRSWLESVKKWGRRWVRWLSRSQ